MTIAVDFDGTIVDHRYPEIGPERPFALETLKKLKAEGHILILWTYREGKRLDEAIEWCRARGLEFHAVNTNDPFEDSMSGPRKINADIYIDDRQVGGLPEWGAIYQMVRNGWSYRHYLNTFDSSVKEKGTSLWKRIFGR